MKKKKYENYDFKEIGENFYRHFLDYKNALKSFRDNFVI